MIDLILDEKKELRLVTNDEWVRVGDDKINSLRVSLPEKVGVRTLSEYNAVLCAALPDGNGFVYELDTSSAETQVDITFDLTAEVQDIRLYIKIYGDGEVVGKTNEVVLSVFEAPDEPTELETRGELLATIAELCDEIADKIAQIETKDAAIGKATVDFAEIKQAIKHWNRQFDEDTDTSDYAEAILDLPVQDDRQFIGVVEKNTERVVIPYGTTMIGEYIFYYNNTVKELVLPASLTSIKYAAICNCANLETLIIPDSVTEIGNSGCSGNTKLLTLHIPAGLTTISDNSFYQCRKVENLTFGNGLNISVLNIFDMEKLSATVVENCFRALADRTGTSTGVIKLHNKVLARLSEEQLDIARNKNWNITE